MRRFQHPFLALLLSLLLLGSQQAALAHVLGHAAATGPSQLAQEDAGHGAVLALSHVCTTCIAFAGADVAPAASLPPPAAPPGRMAMAALAVPPAPTLAFIAAFRSRAPPSL
jgi:hypothetical protein